MKEWDIFKAGEFVSQFLIKKKIKCEKETIMQILALQQEYILINQGKGKVIIPQKVFNYVLEKMKSSVTEEIIIRVFEGEYLYSESIGIIPKYKTFFN